MNCAICNAEDASHDTLVATLKLCDRCYADRVIGRPSDVSRCEECKGTGKTACLQCDGEGERKCDMGHEHECRECDGVGVVRCLGCKGTGKTSARAT